MKNIMWYIQDRGHQSDGGRIQKKLKIFSNWRRIDKEFRRDLMYKNKNGAIRQLPIKYKPEFEHNNSSEEILK